MDLNTTNKEQRIDMAFIQISKQISEGNKSKAFTCFTNFIDGEENIVRAEKKSNFKPNVVLSDCEANSE